MNLVSILNPSASHLWPSSGFALLAKIKYLSSALKPSSASTFNEVGSDVDTGWWSVDLGIQYVDRGVPWHAHSEHIHKPNFKDDRYENFVLSRGMKGIGRCAPDHHETLQSTSFPSIVTNRKPGGPASFPGFHLLLQKLGLNTQGIPRSDGRLSGPCRRNPSSIINKLETKPRTWGVPACWDWKYDSKAYLVESCYDNCYSLVCACIPLHAAYMTCTRYLSSRLSHAWIPKHTSKQPVESLIINTFILSTSSVSME